MNDYEEAVVPVVNIDKYDFIKKNQDLILAVLALARRCVGRYSQSKWPFKYHIMTSAGKFVGTKVFVNHVLSSISRLLSLEPHVSNILMCASK